MRRSFVIILMAAFGACGSGEVVAPAGTPVLPDLIPVPPVDLHTGVEDITGIEMVYFTSVLANVGDGDFLLSAGREGGLIGGATADAVWEVDQQIAYSEAGFETRSIDAALVWGGDGHEHWHVEGIARYWLEPAGEAAEGFEPRYDTKVGFCFFDSHVHDEDRSDRPPEQVYSAESCGTERARTVSMGLSVGWSDTYTWTLPGQVIDVSGLPDGSYRIWAQVDPKGWFVEASTDNNLTWVDIEFSRRDDGALVVDVVDVAPGAET